MTGTNRWIPLAQRDPAAYRFFIPIAAVSGLLMVVGVFGAWHVQRLQRSASDILAINVSSIRAAVEFEITIREMRTAVNRFLLTEDRTNLDALPTLQEEADRWLAEAERWSTTEFERDLIAKIKSGRAHLYAEIDRLPEARRRGEVEEAARELALEVLPNEILVHAKDYLDFNESELAKNSDRNQRTADGLVFGLSLLGTCGCIAGLLVGYGIARGLNRRIIRLTVPIRSVVGKLDEVFGPVKLTASPGLEELESVMRGVADRVDAVIQDWQQSQRKAMHAEKLAAAGQLAAGLAHELRNPLMSMKILVESAAEQSEHDSLFRRDLRVLEEEIERMEGLVVAFLDYARPPHPRKSDVDLQSIIRKTIALAEYRANRRGARIEAVLPATLVHVLVDSDQWHQLLLNLLLNAIDAVPEGGRITVTLESPKGGNQGGDPALASLIVADTGPGLPSEIGDRIFEPFVSTKTTGLGLGLATCRRIAEAHDGRIEARNQPKGGAEFTVFVPAAPHDTVESNGASRSTTVVSSEK